MQNLTVCKLRYCDARLFTYNLDMYIQYLFFPGYQVIKDASASEESDESEEISKVCEVEKSPLVFTVNSFTEESLKQIQGFTFPSSIASLVLLLKAFSKLVCKIKLHQVSNERPEYTSEGDKYIFYKYRGVNIRKPHVASGWVSYISPKLYGRYYRIEIITVRHHIFNDDEAANCSVKLKFEDGTSRELMGFRVGFADTKADVCGIYCLVDDELLVKKLLGFQRLIETQWNILKDEVCNVDDTHGVSYLIAYPLGKKKTISIGEYHVVEGTMSLVYNTPNYRGCSGGAVINFVKGLMVRPHSGSYDLDQIGYSSDWNMVSQKIECCLISILSVSEFVNYPLFLTFMCYF